MVGHQIVYKKGREVFKKIGQGLMSSHFLHLETLIRRLPNLIVSCFSYKDVIIIKKKSVYAEYKEL